MTERTGRCLCGAVTIKLRNDPIVARTCWCRLCQYAAAGNATVNGVFKREDVEISGPLKSVESMPDSGYLKYLQFCPECGTQVGVRSTRSDDIYVVRLGVLDQRDIAPEATIWTSSAPDWACISDAIPDFAEGAPPPVKN